MSEDTKPEAGTEVDLPDNTPEDTSKPEGTPQLTEVEQRALEMGWRPRSEFNGSDDDFIDAKEFVRRKPLFDKIEGQSKELKNVRKAVEALKVHYTKVQETEYNRALAALEAAREEAITNADGAAYTKLDKEIKSVENQMAKVKQIQEAPIVEDQPQIHPEFQAWTNRNQWYTNVAYMRKFADDFGTNLAAQGINDPSVVLRKVEEAVRKEFPQKFINPNKASAPDVDGSKPGQGSKSKDSIELSDQERKVMNMLVSTKTMTKDEYIADIKKLRAAEKSK